MTRQRIFAEIDTERQAQDVKFGGPARDDAHEPNTWVAILSRQVGLASSDEGAHDPERFRRQMVRAAAVAVAALEAIDRKAGRQGVLDFQSGKGY